MFGIFKSSAKRKTVAQTVASKKLANMLATKHNYTTGISNANIVSAPACAGTPKPAPNPTRLQVLRQQRYEQLTSEFVKLPMAKLCNSNINAAEFALIIYHLTNEHNSLITLEQLEKLATQCKLDCPPSDELIMEILKN